MTPSLFDMHVHLDFMRDMQAVAHEAEQLGLGLFATTVTPAGYERTRDALGDTPNVWVGVGLHPWWVADGRCGELDAMHTAELAQTARYVGEIGLDRSPKHVPEGSFEQQLKAFESIVTTCAQTSDAASPKVLSIHSVQAAGVALDTLECTGALGTCRCIFHWFSGSSDELHCAVKAGCWFSVNEMMLRTKRGREYARQLPASRLLLETDLPPGEDVPFAASQIRESLARTAGQLASIRGTTTADICALTCHNSLDVLR